MSLISKPAMRPRGGWRGVGDVEWAVAEYIDWINHRRHGELGHVPPAEYEAAYWSNHAVADYRETSVLAEAGTR
ncbi:transposase (plasmid) [Rhodococcus sp. ZPP]|uniref:IS3 family transposase n=1 Tax=Rhodococcus sp. ZPP TaxID=2749906 RepID=UPI001AD877AE|nr:IS3 family transposase [Rhodococcus sp. ZPP]QTJ70734.1 transposase [Rhodococcus sp. ZPP]